MDAIHNIPHLIQHWDSHDEDWLKSMLSNYEEKWRDHGPCLQTIYEQEVAGQR